MSYSFTQRGEADLKTSVKCPYCGNNVKPEGRFYCGLCGAFEDYIREHVDPNALAAAQHELESPPPE